MARNTQFSVAKGETWRLPITLADSSNNPRDITSYSFTGSLKPTYSDSSTYDFTFNKTVPYDSGSLVVSLDTISIPAGTYVYTIFVNDGTDRRSILEGNFIIRESTL